MTPVSDVTTTSEHSAEARDELNEAIAELYTIQDVGSEKVEAARELLRWQVEYGKAYNRQEVVDLIKSEVGFNKPSVREWLEEVKKENRPSQPSVEAVKRHIYISDEPEFEFEVRAGNGDFSGSFRLPASELTEQRFVSGFSEAVPAVPFYDDFPRAVNGWLADAETVKHIASTEIEEAVADAISGLNVVHSRSDFVTAPQTRAQVADEEVLVSGDVVCEAANRVSAEELAPQAVRRKVDGLMVDGPSRQLRTPDGGRMRAWRFKPVLVVDGA